MFNPPRWLTDARITRFHYGWIHMRNFFCSPGLLAAFAVLLCVVVVGLTARLSYESGYHAALEDINPGDICVSLLDLFKPGASK